MRPALQPWFHQAAGAEAMAPALAFPPRRSVLEKLQPWLDEVEAASVRIRDRLHLIPNPPPEASGTSFETPPSLVMQPSSAPRSARPSLRFSQDQASLKDAIWKGRSPVMILDEHNIPCVPAKRKLQTFMDAWQWPLADGLESSAPGGLTQPPRQSSHRPRCPSRGMPGCQGAAPSAPLGRPSSALGSAAQLPTSRAASVQRRHLLGRQSPPPRAAAEVKRGFTPENGVEGNPWRPEEAKDASLFGDNIGASTQDCEGRVVTLAEREQWGLVFSSLQYDGEIHLEDLTKALKCCGVKDPRVSMVHDVLRNLTPYTSLDLTEFVRFVCLFEASLQSTHRFEFQRFDSDATGTVAIEDIGLLLEKLGMIARQCVVEELVGEVRGGGVGRLDFGRVEKIVSLLSARDGFLRGELEEFRRVFRNFDRVQSGYIITSDLASALAWLGFPISPERTRALYQEEDTDGDGRLSESVFLRCLRRAYECENESIRRFLDAQERDGLKAVSGAAMEAWLRSLGYSTSPEVLIDAAQDAGLLSKGDTLCGPTSLDGLEFNFAMEDLCTLLATLRAKEGFTHAQMLNLRHAFDRFNPKGLKEIATPAIRQALRWLGHPFPFDVVKFFVAEVELNGAHSLNFVMFVKLVRKCQDMDRARYVAAFHQADAHGQKRLNYEQQQLACKALGLIDDRGKAPARSPEERTGVGIHCFVQICQRGAEVALRSLRANAGFSEKELVKLRKCFARFDRDESGDITRSELARLVEVVMPMHAHAPEWRPYLKKLLSDVDADGSGSLDFAEFVCLMRAIYDHEVEIRFEAEEKTIQDLGFSQQEANAFRSLFVAADGDGNCLLSLQEVRVLIARCCSLGGKKNDFLQMCFDDVVGKDGSEQRQAGFLEFLRIMRMVIDSHLMNVKDWVGMAEA